MNSSHHPLAEALTAEPFTLYGDQPCELPAGRDLACCLVEGRKLGALYHLAIRTCDDEEEAKRYVAAWEQLAASESKSDVLPKLVKTGRDREFARYVSEEISGEPVTRYVMRNGRFSPVRAAELTLSLADGLLAIGSDFLSAVTFGPESVWVVGESASGDGLRLVIGDLGFVFAEEGADSQNHRLFCDLLCYLAGCEKAGAAQAAGLPDVYGCGSSLADLAKCLRGYLEQQPQSAISKRWDRVTAPMPMRDAFAVNQVESRVPESPSVNVITKKGDDDGEIIRGLIREMAPDSGTRSRKKRRSKGERKAGQVLPLAAGLMVLVGVGALYFTMDDPVGDVTKWLSNFRPKKTQAFEGASSDSATAKTDDLMVAGADPSRNEDLVAPSVDSDFIEEMDDDTPEAALLLSRYHEKQGDLELAGEARKKFAVAKNRPDTITDMAKKIFDDGDAPAEDLAKARKMFLDAAELGDSNAKYYAGECLIFGRGGDVDYLRGVQFLSESSADGNAQAMDLLGVCYIRGWGVERDDERAFELFNQAVELEYLPAKYNLGVRYFLGQGVDRNVNKAADIFEEGSRQGDANCMLVLARCYEKGIGRELDTQKAMVWYVASAKKGHPEAVRWCEENQISSIVATTG